MGILYPISKHVNDLINKHLKSGRPDWAMDEKTKRAVRFATQFAIWKKVQ